MTTKYPGEKLLDPSNYGFDEYLVVGLALFVVFVTIKHLIFHTMYFWWYREGQFYLPDRFWSFVSGKTLTQRLMKYISASTSENTVSVEQLMSLMDDYFKTKEFAPSLSTTKGKVVDDIVMEYQPKEVLVVGCHVGYVLLQILKSLPGNARIFVVESNDEFSAFSKLLLKLVGEDDKVVFVNNELNKATLENFKRDYGVEKFDFIFLNRTNYNQPSHVPLLKLLEGDSDQGCGYIHSKKQNGTGSVILADKVVLLGDPEFLKYVRLSKKYETKYYQMALEHSSDEIVDGMEKAVLLEN